MSFPEGRDLVLIVGMHRSGTSALGRLFDRLGFYFGEDLLKTIDGVNADGFWEDATVVATNEKIFRQLDSAWYSFLKLPPQWWKKPEILAHYENLENWYSEGFSHRFPVCIKDPRFCRTFPFWQEFFNRKQIQPKVVFIYRHPFSVAASLYQRDSLSFEASQLLWLSYTLDAIEYIQKEPMFLVCYEKLVNRPADIVADLFEGIFKDITVLRRHRIFRVVTLAIDPEKNHHPVTASMGERQASAYGALAEELYHELEKAAPGHLASIAKQYRKRFDALLENEKISSDVFQHEINSLVEANKKLSGLGEAHTFALDTIAKKDRIYEASLAGFEKRIAGNKTYIKKCHARIREQDAQLKKLGQKSQQVEHLEACLRDRENKIAENVSYIRKCEERIRQQDQLLLERQRSSLLWPLLYLRRKVRALFAKPPVL